MVQKSSSVILPISLMALFLVNKSFRFQVFTNAIKEAEMTVGNPLDLIYENIYNSFP